MSARAGAGADQSFPARVRRRLVIAFVLVAAVSSGGLAVTTYALVRHTRLDTFRERSEELAEVTISLLPDGADPARLTVLLERFAEREGADFVVLDGDGSSSAGLPGPSAVPADVRTEVDEEGRGTAATSVSGERYLVVGGTVPGSSDVYLFFSEQELTATLGSLGRVLAVGCVLVVVGAGLAGSAIATRTLQPVKEAAAAASALAEGLLDTRLQVRDGDEFGAWAFSFNTMAAALSDKIVALEVARDRERRFAADVSHELRTPVTSLVAAASLLEQAELPDGTRRPAELVATESRRLRVLIEDLLELLRLEAGQEGPALDAHRLGALAAASLRRSGWDQQVPLEVASDPLVLVEPRRLDRVLANLVGNGLAHGGGDVRVVVGRDGASTIEVRDRGPGIAEHDLPHLFEPFFQSDRSRTGSGSGLGLAIADENARAIGGHIDVESREDGATFVLHLRLAEAHPVGEPLHQGIGRRTSRDEAVTRE